MSYGIALAGATTDKSDHGSGASLDNIAAGTVVFWYYPSDIANAFRGIIGKYTGGMGWEIIRRGVDGATLRILIERATTNTDAISTASIAANTWQFIVVRWSIAGNVASIYRGLIASAIANITASSQAGSGTQDDDSAISVIIGNETATSASAIPATIATVAIYNTSLSDADAEKLRLRPLARLAGHVLDVILGNNGSVGTQVDLSGNGNDGTITGATASSIQLPLALHGRLVNGGANTRSLVGRGLAA